MLRGCVQIYRNLKMAADFKIAAKTKPGKMKKNSIKLVELINNMKINQNFELSLVTSKIAAKIANMSILLDLNEN